jgi:hypothetical protein
VSIELTDDEAIALATRHGARFVYGPLIGAMAQETSQAQAVVLLPRRRGRSDVERE